MKEHRWWNSLPTWLFIAAAMFGWMLGSAFDNAFDNEWRWVGMFLVLAVSNFFNACYFWKRLQEVKGESSR